MNSKVRGAEEVRIRRIKVVKLKARARIRSMRPVRRPSRQKGARTGIRINRPSLRPMQQRPRRKQRRLELTLSIR